MIKVGLTSGSGYTGMDWVPPAEYSVVDVSALTSRDKAGGAFSCLLANFPEIGRLWRLPVLP